MNDKREGDPSCYFHPREVVVGICHLCLRERLLILASKQKNHNIPPKDSINHRSFRTTSVKFSTVIPKVFALGFLLGRPGRYRRKPGDSDEENSIHSLDDSFISIKFENDGRANWDKKKASSSKNGGGTTVVEHRGGLRWRKRVGQLMFQALRWKKATNGQSEVVVGPAKGRRGSWMRRLTRRRTVVNL